MFGERPMYNAQYAMDSSGRILNDGRDRARAEQQQQQDMRIAEQRRQGDMLIDQNARMGDTANALRNASSARTIAEENARQLAMMYGTAASNLNNTAAQTQGNLASLAGGMMQAALR